MRPARAGRPVAAPALAALALALAGCAGPEAPEDETAGDAAAGDVESGAESGNPVIAEDFPDPDVLEVDGTYYAYATNGNNRNVRVARSTDLRTWEELDDALPDLPAWVIPGKTWAPEVTALPGGGYAMYVTATNFRPTAQCIALATSDRPEGPFTVVGEGMLVCPQEEGGAIDASTFTGPDGQLYLLWKNDGNCCGLDTWLSIAPLSADGTTVGEPTRLLRQDQPWEGDLIEAPTLVERQGRFVLLYSANDYGGPAYAIGYATAEDVLGPYTKAAEPLLTTEATGGQYVGPGGQDVVAGPDGQDLLAFHSWYGGQTYRAMNLLPVAWEDGEPRVVLE